MNSITVRFHKDREEILHFCNNHKHIHLFGTGLIASQIFEYLQEEGIDIKSFIVSDGHKEGDKKSGIIIEELSKAVISSEDGIILAVNSYIQKEIDEALRKKGIREEQLYHQHIYSVSSRPVVMEDSFISLENKANRFEEGFFSGYEELNNLGNKYQTDKSDILHNYLKKYEFFLKGWKEREFTLLELGVLDGSSLRMWEEYFKRAQIHGVDINPDCRKEGGGRRHIHIMDLSSLNSYEKLTRLFPSIIIDDGSHIWSHQLKSLFYLFEVLPSGGIFIMEDLETSFPAYRSLYYADASVSTYDVLSSIAEVVCSNEVIRKENTLATIWDLHEEIEQIASMVECISIVHGSCILIKK